MLPDTDALSTYGGALQNYSAVVDPTTDEDADSRNTYAGNVAMMTHTIVRAIRSFTGDSASPGDPGSGLIHDAVWGNDPGDKSSVANAGTGIYDLTWPATVLDELGNSHSIDFRRAWAQVEQSDGTFRAAHAKVTGPNTVRVYTYSGTTLNDLSTQVITVFVV
jgi:hypothetical protein